MIDESDIFKKSQEFNELINQQKEFLQEVLKENEKLRYQIAQLKSHPHNDGLFKEEIEILSKLGRNLGLLLRNSCLDFNKLKRKTKILHKGTLRLKSRITTLQIYMLPPISFTPLLIFKKFYT